MATHESLHVSVVGLMFFIETVTLLYIAAVMFCHESAGKRRRSRQSRLQRSMLRV